MLLSNVMLGSYDDDEMMVVVALKSKLLLLFIISIVEVIKFLRGTLCS